MIEELVESGEAFDHVEDAIESTGLKEDSRAALWLLAFFEQQHERRLVP